MIKFLIFLFFGLFRRFLWSKTLKFRFFDPEKSQKRPKNQKIKNLIVAIVEGRQTNVCTNF